MQKKGSGTLRGVMSWVAEKVYLDPVRRKLDKVRYPGAGDMGDPSDFQPASRGAKTNRELDLERVLKERVGRVYGRAEVVELQEVTYTQQPGNQPHAVSEAVLQSPQESPDSQTVDFRQPDRGAGPSL